MIEVKQHASIEALRPLRDEIDRLNRDSRRRCPFTTFELLANVVAHDELFVRPGAPRPLFLTAHEGGRLTGLLALRATTEHVARVPYTKLEWLLTLEVDRPHLVARPEDEVEVARAMWRHLSRARWSMIELSQQDEDSALLKAIDEVSVGPVGRCFVRELASRDGNVLALRDAQGAKRFDDVSAYIQALSRKQRSNVKRSVIDVLARPGMTMVSSSNDDAAPLLFELYLDVERRSWKARGDAAVSRSAARIAYYRALFGAPMKLTVDVLLEDGVPIAGHVTGAYAGSTYFLQTVYDERLDDVSPGTLMLLWSVKQALDEGVATFNMLPDFSYYKARWLADVVPTKTLQVFRKGSLPWAKAVAGEVKRRLTPPPSTTAALQNASKLEADRKVHSPPPPDRELAARVLLELERLGVRPLTAAELLRALPFDGAVRTKAKVA